MTCTTTRALRVVAGLTSIASALLLLDACETTTQRCMKERESCREDCASKDQGERGKCHDACDDALNKCMAQ